MPKAGDKVFVELKKKCGGVVYKRRVTAPLPQAERFLRTETAPAEWGQIGQKLQWFQHFYDTMPRMYIGYDRTAWAGTEDPALRITFARNIRWRRDRLPALCGCAGRFPLSIFIPPRFRNTGRATRKCAGRPMPPHG